MVAEMSGTWEQDWPTRVYERISERGFHSLSEFFDSRPMVSLISLADELGPNVAAVQLESLWFREAEVHGRLPQVLASLLIRYVRESIPQGWRTGDTFDSMLADAFATWENIADLVLSESARDRVWDCLRSLSPAPGWLPVVPPDALTSSLLEAIASALAGRKSLTGSA